MAAMEYPNILQSSASITAAASPTLTFNGASPGFNQALSVHSTTGVYDLCLDTPLVSSNVAFAVTPRSQNAGDNVQADLVTSGGNTFCRVTADRSGSASDSVSFDVLVFQRPG